MEIIKEDQDYVYVKQIIVKIHKKRKRYIDTEGYVRIFVGYDYEGNFRGYVREHTKVIQDELHRKLTKRETVHHKDHNKQNNKIENLELMTQRTHGWYHNPRWTEKFKDRVPAN